MKAIILAAGRGSRMGEGTENIPKCMMTLGGRTLLDRCIDSLKQAGFESSDIGIVTGYKREKIQIKDVQYFHNADWANTNMFFSLTMAGELLKKEPCIVCYSDIVFSPNAIKMLIKSDSEFAITSYTEFWNLWQIRFDNPLDDLETFKLSDGRLVEIGNKPLCKDEVQGQYMGLLRFTPFGWEKVIQATRISMPKPLAKLDMTTLLQHLINLGHEIEVVETNDLWLECDNLYDIQIYERGDRGIIVPL